MSNKKILIIQPLPGIGDCVWHLSHFHALAATTSFNKVSILTKPRSKSDQILGCDPQIDQVLWLERKPGKHDGFLGIVRLVKLLRSKQFDSVWVLHQSVRYALICWLAGIPSRYGYGFGLDRYFYNHQCLQQKHKSLHPIKKANQLLSIHGVTLISSHCDLPICSALQKQVIKMFSLENKQFLVFGIGSSEASKLWPAEYFSSLILKLNRKNSALVYILLGGGKAEKDFSNNVIHMLPNSIRGNLVNGINLSIKDSLYLISGAKCYIGNDTGFLNLAASLGITSFGLFGSSPPLTFSPNLHAISPSSARVDQYTKNDAGMKEITVEQVYNACVDSLDEN